MTTASATKTTPSTLEVNEKKYRYHSLTALDAKYGGRVARLPFSLRVLLENLLRNLDGVTVSQEDIDALVNWDPRATPDREIAFRPARVLLQDFTGVPAVVDLAAMRDAMAALNGNASRINPLQQVDLVIDHSVQVDEYGSSAAELINTRKEYERNGERYAFLRWGQKAFANFRVVPPDTGIVHQVNLEYLASVAFTRKDDGETLVYPDTLVGTDSHTTMINGLGVVGWGVGGIEAEAAMLGQPISMLIPQVVGFRMTGKLRAGATATDLVLTATQLLRRKGVVGMFVEYCGPGLSALSLADRATIANMSPEYGATIGFFPVDDETLKYLRFTGRNEEQVALVEAYYKAQGLFRTAESPDPIFTDVVELDLSTVVPSLAGPRRPQDRIPLTQSKPAYRKALIELVGEKHLVDVKKEAVASWVGEGGATVAGDSDGGSPDDSHLGPISARVSVKHNGSSFDLKHGHVVIAAITSCTNTSNPSVLIAAGLLAKKAAARGLTAKPWVKTSLAPGSRVVTDYLTDAGLMTELEKIGFYLVGYGCTTCIGNSGPLAAPISKAIAAGNLVATAVLSGNRNFEGRISPDVRANYLASPPLVVAYALAGTMDIDLDKEPLGRGSDGLPVFLRDVWPTPEEVTEVIRQSVRGEMYNRQYANVFVGDDTWRNLPVPEGDRYAWDATSLYVKRPPYFDGMTMDPAPVRDIVNARVLCLLGDSVTTDHISPAGEIPTDSPAGRYLIERGSLVEDFNSYGSRRGNHEVMMRGTFANIRLKNRLAPGTEGGWTRHQPSGEQMTIFDASNRYRNERVPLIVIAGKEYGSGSSRDWAAKGPALLGVRAAIAESFERIHRSNLIGMGVLPLQFADGETPATLGLDGTEEYTIAGLAGGEITPGATLIVNAVHSKGAPKAFSVRSRIDTPDEALYYINGGILHFVLRQLVGR